VIPEAVKIDGGGLGGRVEQEACKIWHAGATGCI
jgi:hypothetical protein